MKRLIVLLFFVFASAASHATFFYRMDTRPPEDIFRNGFTPGGNHPSIFQHVIGHTCQPGLRATAFIAASANETFAVNWGRENQPEGTRFYVYRIRASEHFYNAVQSLFHASRQTNDAAYEVAGWMYMAESEWVTPVAIPPEDILGAAEYVSRGRDQAPGHTGVYIPSGARDTPGAVNDNPFTWDYDLDQSEPPSLFNPLCPSVCFGAGHHVSKRSPSVEWIEGLSGGGDGSSDEARRKSDHILACGIRTASAAFGFDLFPPPTKKPRPQKTEL